MQLTGQRLLPIDRATTWRALNDPAVLKECIPGCQAIDRTGDNDYAITIAAALGPVKTTFRGRLKVEDIVERESYTLRFEGEGGAAGFAKGSAKVHLSDAEGTRMEYSADAQIGGRLAQVGNRLIDSAARKLAEEFFTAFEQHVAPTAPAAAAPEPGRRVSIPRYWAVIAIAAAILAIVALLR